MPDVAEFTGPLGYSSLWVWSAIAALVLVVLFYLAVILWSYGGQSDRSPRVDIGAARSRAMSELDRIGHQVYAAEVSERVGHQQLSAVIRGFVSSVSTLPAHTMTLADLREAGVPHLADTIALLYPPEFAPEVAATEPFAVTLDHGRQVVLSWN